MRLKKVCLSSASLNGYSIAGRLLLGLQKRKRLHLHKNQSIRNRSAVDRTQITRRTVRYLVVWATIVAFKTSCSVGVTVDDTKLMTWSTAVSVLLNDNAENYIAVNAVEAALACREHLKHRFAGLFHVVISIHCSKRGSMSFCSVWQLRLSYLIHCLVASSRSKWALLDKCHPQT